MGITLANTDVEINYHTSFKIILSALTSTN